VWPALVAMRSEDSADQVTATSREADRQKRIDVRVFMPLHQVC
jgi:hypothetical protein